MPKAVYRMMSLLCALVVDLPLATNLGLFSGCLVSGRLLAARGSVIPGLDTCSLVRREVRRAWATLGSGAWTSERLLTQWVRQVTAEGRWQVQTHGGYHTVPVDVTVFWDRRSQPTAGRLRRVPGQERVVRSTARCSPT